MFTGIIEEMGKVAEIKRNPHSAAFSIAGDRIFDDLKIGDSVATNGVCLTVRQIKGKRFVADVMAETLKRSSLGSLKWGDPVNLERAMPADGRFGGHIVSGHIDGTGVITATRLDDNAKWFTVQARPSIMGMIVEKGSVALDGISLTVAEVGDTWFSVSIIPHTMGETVLGQRRPGDKVNIENDIIGKYVQRLMGGARKSEVSPKTLTKEALLKAGF